MDGNRGQFSFFQYRLHSHTRIFKKVHGHAGGCSKWSHAMDCRIWPEIFKERVHWFWLHFKKIVFLWNRKVISWQVTLNHLWDQMTRPGMSSRTGIHTSKPDQFGPIGFRTWRFVNPWLRSWSTNEGPKASQISNPNPMGQNQTKSTTLYLSTFSIFLIEMKSKSTTGSILKCPEKHVKDDLFMW